MTNVSSALSIEKEPGAGLDRTEGNEVNVKMEVEPDSYPVVGEINGCSRGNQESLTGESSLAKAENHVHTTHLVGISADNDGIESEPRPPCDYPAFCTSQFGADTVVSSNVIPGASNGPKRFQKNAQYHGTGRLPCPELGEGWYIEQIVRQQGKSAGRYDTYYYSPDSMRIRSKLKLQEYVVKDLTNFDYNSGKFIDKEDASILVVPPKPKMSLLKTEELKTIDRQSGTSTEKTVNTRPSPKKLTIKLPPRKKQLKGPYSAALQTFDKKQRKKQKSRKRKRILPGLSIKSAIHLIEDDAAQNNPFDAFKREAVALSSHFTDIEKDYEDLIQFAWNFLSIESKTQFNNLALADEKAYHMTSRCMPFSQPYARDTSIYKEMQEYSLDWGYSSCHKQFLPPEKFHHHKSHDTQPSKANDRGMCSECSTENCQHGKDMAKCGASSSRKQYRATRKCKNYLPVDSVSSPSLVPQKTVFGGNSNMFSHTISHFLDNRNLSSPPMNSLRDMNKTHGEANSQQLSATETTKGTLTQQNNNISCITTEGWSDSANAARNLFSYINSSAATAVSLDAINTSLSSNNTDSSGGVDHDYSPQKLHKRKSRRPVCIKQTPGGIEQGKHPP